MTPRECELLLELEVAADKLSDLIRGIPYPLPGETELSRELGEIFRIKRRLAIERAGKPVAR